MKKEFRDALTKMQKQHFPNTSIQRAWATRFHNLIPQPNNKRGEPSPPINPTNDWMFFISRPGLEFCRKNDPNGESAFNFYRDCIRRFISEKGNAREYLKGDGKRTQFNVESFVDEKSGTHITFMYPFSLDHETKRKIGVVFHIGRNEDAKSIENQKFFYDLKPSITMFDTEFQTRFSEECKFPAGLEKEDPLWCDFSSSKVFLTDLIIREENPVKWGSFRNYLTMQFNEIRLLEIPRSVIGEQYAALQEFQDVNTGYINFSGAPGTGKSTMLHMICADRIAKNWAAEESESRHKILYYVPSQGLKEEAEREIESILALIYRLSNSDAEQLVRGKNSSIRIVTQEELATVQRPDSRYNLTTKLSTKEMELNQKIAFTPEYPVGLFKEHLRRFLFGLFETRHGVELLNPSVTESNSKNAFEKVQQNWTSRPLDLIHPKTRQSRRHDFSADKFMPIEYRDKFLKHLKKIPVYEGTGVTKYWDPAALITATHTKFHRDSGAQNFWKDWRGKADYIVIDEVQDIAVSEVRVLLEHFSARQEDQPVKPFRFIAAGDEFQNIQSLVFSERNSHIRATYEDWVTDRAVKFNSAEYGNQRLSEGLDNIKEIVLEASYRSPVNFLDIMNRVMDEIRHKADQEGFRKTTRRGMEEVPFSREGVLLNAMSRSGKSSKTLEENERAWIEEFRPVLQAQFNMNEGKIHVWDNSKQKVVKIALIYSQSDLNPNLFGEGKHPLSDRMKDNPWYNMVNKVLLEFTTAFSRWFEQQNRLKEEHRLEVWKTEVEACGVFSTEQIKGKTVPISIILPRAEFEGSHEKLGRNEWSDFLVQFTRAQYMNVLLNNPDIIEVPENIVSEQKITDIGSWLSTVVMNSNGYALTIDQAYRNAMMDHENINVWNRLREMVKSHPNPVLFGDVTEWIKTLYRKVYSGGFSDLDDSISWDKPKKTFSLESSSKSGHQHKSQQITLLEFENNLGNRFSPEKMANVQLFCFCNHYMQSERNGFNEDKFVSLLDNWLSLEAERSEQPETQSWFEIFTQKTRTSSKSMIREIQQTFSLKNIRGNHSPDEHGKHKENSANADDASRITESHASDWEWPTTMLPRINMGSWRFIPPIDRDQHDGTWMDFGTSYYTIPVEVLLELTKYENRIENASLFRMFFGLVMRNATIFWEAMNNRIQKLHQVIDHSSERDSINDLLHWFVEIKGEYTNTNSTKVDEEGRRFFDDVRRLMEESASREAMVGALRFSLMKFIEASRDRGEFISRLKQLNFNDWSLIISEGQSLQNAIAFSAQAIQDNQAYLRLGIEIKHKDDELIGVEEKRKNKKISKDEFEKRRKIIEDEKFALEEERTREASLIKLRQRIAAKEETLENDYRTDGEFYNFFTQARKLTPDQHDMFWSLNLLPELTNGGFETKKLSRLLEAPGRLRKQQEGQEDSLPMRMKRWLLPSTKSTTEKNSELYLAFDFCLNYWTVEVMGHEVRKQNLLEAKDSWVRSIFDYLNSEQATESDQEHLLNFILSMNQYVSSAGRRWQDFGNQNVKVKEGNFPRFDQHFYQLLRGDTRLRKKLAELLLNENSTCINQSQFTSMLNGLPIQILYALLGKGVRERDDLDEMMLNFPLQQLEGRNQRIPDNKRFNFNQENFTHLTFSPLETDPYDHLLFGNFYEGMGLLDKHIQSDYSTEHLNKAIHRFESCGLLNISGALRLMEVYENEVNGDRYETRLVNTFIELLRKERQTLLDAMYHNSPVVEKIRSDFSSKRYGLGYWNPNGERSQIEGEDVNFFIDSNLKWLKLHELVEEKAIFYTPEGALGNIDRDGSREKRTQRMHVFNGMKKLKMVDRKENEPRFAFFKFHERVENMEKLANALEELVNSTTKDELHRRISDIDLSEYVVSILGRTEWIYQPSQGYMPTGPQDPDPGIEKIVEFIQFCLKQPGRYKFRQQLCQFSGLKGLMKGFVLDGMIEAEIDTEHEWEQLLRNIARIIAEDDQQSLLNQLVINIKNEISHDSILKWSTRRRKNNLYDFVDEFEEERGLRQTIAGQCRERIDEFLANVDGSVGDATTTPRE